MSEFLCIEDLNQPLVISYETNLETNDNSLTFTPFNISNADFLSIKNN